MSPDPAAHRPEHAALRSDVPPTQALSRAAGTSTAEALRGAQAGAQRLAQTGLPDDAVKARAGHLGALIEEGTVRLSIGLGIPPDLLRTNTPPSPLIDQAAAAMRSDPCRYLGHRAAWLTSGGVACGRCGMPL